MSFRNYTQAALYADKNNLPFWDTHSLPNRYFVGHLTAEMEEDPKNADWEELS